MQAPAPLPLHRNFIQFNGCARAKWPTARSYFEMILKAARRRSVPCLKNPGDVIYSTKFGATWRYSSAHTWNRKLHCKTRPGSNICKSILRFECMYECQGMATGNCCQRKRSPPVLVQILKITSTDLHSSAFQPGSPLHCGPCSYQEVHHLESSKHKQFCPPAA